MIERFRMLWEGRNPKELYAEARQTDYGDEYQEIAVSISGKDNNCLAEVLITLDDDGELRVMSTHNGECEGVLDPVAYPLRAL